jgi:tRNA wybutosine-synthesizing protein 2
MRVRAVPDDQLRELGKMAWVDRTRRPFRDDGITWVPVRSGEPCDREITSPPLYQGRGFYMIGDIAVIHGPRPTAETIDGIIDLRHPRGILWIASINEVMRTPKTEVVWGECGAVSHKENGYTYILDPRKVMFSQGNREEKRRVTEQVRSGTGHERVADMFAGIGYFTIPLAGAGARVHAMEINPTAFDFLNRSLEANGLSDRVTASLGDCRGLLDGTYDRIIMGHFDALNMLPVALQHVRKKSVLHVHTLGPRSEQIETELACAGFSATIQVHMVKKYRPHVWHVVQDVCIG